MRLYRSQQIHILFELTEQGIERWVLVNRQELTVCFGKSCRSEQQRHASNFTNERFVAIYGETETHQQQEDIYTNHHEIIYRTNS